MIIEWENEQLKMWEIEKVREWVQEWEWGIERDIESERVRLRK